ncbi:hypothetical protein B0H17DRAFT_159231 [Mycena rosella]|uniref:Uncharacterized protein n=1 Tax=Mycena rosella TaxID=1033263 RepID=A0AAD7D1H3_MYCRO|nr:hypothetical protein B0H17DRAFT_159231 [Mycena rosella]
MVKDAEKRKRSRSRDRKERDREGEHRSEKDTPKERDRDSHSNGHGSGKDKGNAREGTSSSAAAAYGPEFLRAFAKPASILSGRSKHDDDDGASFDVISGVDARRFARKFVREQAAETEADKEPEEEEKKDEGTSDGHAMPKANARTLPPVVFAFPRSAAGGAGRKVIDFYMSWRGKTRTTRLKGLSRRTGFLDAEFRRVRETLDGEWKRASRALKCSASTGALGKEAGVPRLVRAPTDPQPLPRLPPLLAEYAREEREGTPAPTMTARSVSDPLPPPSSFPLNGARPPLGAHRGSIDSVTSLPLLGMVRGVPAGNRGSCFCLVLGLIWVFRVARESGFRLERILRAGGVRSARCDRRASCRSRSWSSADAETACVLLWRCHAGQRS